MTRLTGIVVLLLVVCLAAPALAKAAQAAVPALVSLVVFLGIARLAFPPHRRRR